MKRHLLLSMLLWMSYMAYCSIIEERDCFTLQVKAQELEEEKVNLDEAKKKKEAELERNERLASKSRYLTNKGSYMEVKLDAKDGDNITAQLESAFILARTKATEEIPYKIILPKGVYYLSSTLHIYSNTQFIMEDATLVRAFQEGPMLMAGSAKRERYEGEKEKNIIVEGGVFDGNCSDELYGAITTPFSNLSFSYAENILLRNVTILNNMGGHHVEMNGVDYVRIENCMFKYYYENKTVTNSYGKEAVRFGTVLEKTGLNSEENIVSCNHILVQNNKFQNVYRGIGFQYIAGRKYYSQISIKKNQFLDCEEAIIISSLLKSNISDNHINYVKVGILIESLSPVSEKKQFDCQIKENEIKNGKNLKISPMISNPYLYMG